MHGRVRPGALHRKVFNRGFPGHTCGGRLLRGAHGIDGGWLEGIDLRLLGRLLLAGCALVRHHGLTGAVLVHHPVQILKPLFEDDGGNFEKSQSTLNLSIQSGQNSDFLGQATVQAFSLLVSVWTE